MDICAEMNFLEHEMLHFGFVSIGLIKALKVDVTF